MSADPTTGLIYLPVEASTNDVYGGARQGQNLYSSSLVVLEAETGKVRWSRQLVHHDIWDWGCAAIPILADVPGDGRTIPAVLQITKQGFVFAFNRHTGEPLWPIEERAVPQSDTPGEATSPTQPFPTVPIPFDRQGVTVDDLIDFTPHRAEALEAVKPYRLGSFMAPPSLARRRMGREDSVASAFSRWRKLGRRRRLRSRERHSLCRLDDQPQYSVFGGSRAGSDVPYVYGGGRPPQVGGLSLIKPPYGRITAIDMKTGHHAWMIANADTPDAIRNNPALAGVASPRTGVVSRAGLLATKTLLFAGEGLTGSPVFRAHDKATGAILGRANSARRTDGSSNDLCAGWETSTSSCRPPGRRRAVAAEVVGPSLAQSASMSELRPWRGRGGNWLGDGESLPHTSQKAASFSEPTS